MLPAELMPLSNDQSTTVGGCKVVSLGVHQPIQQNTRSLEHGGEIFRKSFTVNDLRLKCPHGFPPYVTLYGYRHYTPKTGQFLGRDPIGEQGGENLYAFVWNDGLDEWDYLGMIIPLETIADVVSIGHSTYELYTDPSWGNAGFLAWDVAATCLPYVPGSYIAKGVKVCNKVDDAADEARRLTKIKAEREARKKLEREAKDRAAAEAKDRVFYSTICTQKVPATITDPCEIAKWELARDVACLAPRVRFRDKWKKGEKDHEIEIKNARQAVKNSEARVETACACQQKTIHDKINKKCCP